MSKGTDLIEGLQIALEVTPENQSLRRHLAGLLAEAGRYAEAVEQYLKCLDAAPKDSELKLALAKAYRGAKKLDVALVVFEDLIRSGAASGPVLIDAARLYLETGDPRLAAKTYAQALALDPGLRDAGLEKQMPGLSKEKATLETPPPPEDKPVYVLAKGKPGEFPLKVEKPAVTFEDVGGLEKVKEEIRMKIIYPLGHANLFKAYGKSSGGGVLLYGPPGCGKNYLARATAGEVKASFVSVGLHDVLDMRPGNSERNLHSVFEAARRQAPCVLFLDEVDALGASRADMRYASMRQMIGQFLSEMDGVNTPYEGLLILAATNAPWYVDMALRRPGSFDRVLFVPPPDLQARESILRILARDKSVQGLDYSRLARETNNFSGADLRGALDTAIERKLQEAVQPGKPVPLTTQDVLAVIKTTHPSTVEWLETARNYAIYSNEGGIYDEILEYLNLPKGTRF